jgi:hypothetical protein
MVMAVPAPSTYENLQSVRPSVGTSGDQTMVTKLVNPRERQTGSTVLNADRPHAKKFALNRNALFVAAILVVLTGSADAAIIAGDVILIDFGKTTAETTGNWNNIARDTTVASDGWYGNAGTLDASLNRLSDNAETSVALVVSSPGNSETGIGALTATAGAVSFTSIGAIPGSAQVDVAFVQNDNVTYSFTGLNDSLTYNVELLSKVDAAQARNTTDVTIGGVTIFNIDPNDGLVYAFNNLSATSGNLTISFSGTGPSAELFHINALQLIAVPEPTTIVTLASAVGFLGLHLARRRRMRRSAG